MESTSDQFIFCYNCVPGEARGWLISNSAYKLYPDCLSCLKGCYKCGKPATQGFDEDYFPLMCMKCSKDVEGVISWRGRSWKSFKHRIEMKLLGKVIGEYKDTRTHVYCLCQMGHQCYTRPGDIYSYYHIPCDECKKIENDKYRILFIKILNHKTKKIIGQYKNLSTCVKCICVCGRICNPSPFDVIKRKRGICIKCSGHDSETSKLKFVNRIKEFGGVVCGVYVKNNIPVFCICPNGHNCYPRPGDINNKNTGMCNTCTGKTKDSVKGLVIDSHLSHYLPKEYVDTCIITKCNLKLLKKRLEERGYSKNKVRENLDVEIFDTCRLEALEAGHKVKIIETD